MMRQRSPTRIYNFKSETDTSLNELEELQRSYKPRDDHRTHWFTQEFLKPEVQLRYISHMYKELHFDRNGDIHSYKFYFYILLFDGYFLILLTKALAHVIRCHHDQEFALTCSSIFEVFACIFIAIVAIVFGISLCYVCVLHRTIHHINAMGSQNRGDFSSVENPFLYLYNKVETLSTIVYQLAIPILMYKVILSSFVGTCNRLQTTPFLSLCMEQGENHGFYFIAPVFQLTGEVIPNFLTIALSSVGLLITTLATLPFTTTSGDDTSPHLILIFSFLGLLTISYILYNRGQENFLAIEALNKNLLDQVAISEELETEKFNHKIDLALVYQILPPEIVEAIRTGAKPENKKLEHVTIFFSDVVGYTDISRQVSEIEVMTMLNNLYTVMDYCTEIFDLYKVETIGDAYMCAGGVKTGQQTDNGVEQACAVAAFAIVVKAAIAALVKNPVDGSVLQIRIGIHSGPTVAGVVGSLMPRYCLFGDTVNTASRMESNSEPGRIHCSSSTAALIKEDFIVLDRGEITIKGKGLMNTHWVENGLEHNTTCHAGAISNIVSALQRLLRVDNEDMSVATRASKIELLRSMSASGRMLHRGSSQNSFSNREMPPMCTQTTFAIQEILEEEKAVAVMEINNLSDVPSESMSTRSSLGSQALSRTLSNFLVMFGMSEKTSDGALSRSSSQSDHFSLADDRFKESPQFKLKLKLEETKMSTVRRSMFKSDSIVDAINVRFLFVDYGKPGLAALGVALQRLNSTWVVDTVRTAEKALEKCKACMFLYDIIHLEESQGLSDTALQSVELVALVRENESSNTRKKTSPSIIIGMCTAATPEKQRSVMFDAGCDVLWSNPLPEDMKIIQVALLDLWKSRGSVGLRKVVTWDK